MISPDTDIEVGFEIPELLVEHGVRSMVNVVIRGERAAWGVLEVNSRQRRDFNEDDISFLQNYANLLAAAIERLQTEAELKDAADRGSILTRRIAAPRPQHVAERANPRETNSQVERKPGGVCRGVRRAADGACANPGAADPRVGRERQARGYASAGA